MSEVENEVQTEVTEGQVPEEVNTGPTIIQASNPTTEEMAELREAIKANYDFDVNVSQTRFNFKKSTDKDSGIETVREAVELAIPYPTVDGIMAILKEGGKGLELLQEVMEGAVNSVAREILAEDTTLNAANFPVDKLAWGIIAAMPKPERRGGGIPKEVWDLFITDYVAVMPEATGKSVLQVNNAAAILKSKFSTTKTNVPVLEMLGGQLAIYAEASERVAEFADCLDFLLSKLDTLMNISPEELLAAL